MKRTLIGGLAACCVLSLCVASALSARAGKDGGVGEFAIYVAPGTIVRSAACTWVTIHTNVPFTTVEGVAAAVDASDVDVARAFADDCGNLVVKLKFDDVTACVAPPSATVALTIVVAGESRTASETVPVR